MEDTEEPVDVNDAEWQKTTSDEIFGPGVHRHIACPLTKRHVSLIAEDRHAQLACVACSAIMLGPDGA